MPVTMNTVGDVQIEFFISKNYFSPIDGTSSLCFLELHRSIDSMSRAIIYGTTLDVLSSKKGVYDIICCTLRPVTWAPNISFISRELFQPQRPHGGCGGGFDLRVSRFRPSKRLLSFHLPHSNNDALFHEHQKRSSRSFCHSYLPFSIPELNPFPHQ